MKLLVRIPRVGWVLAWLLLTFLVLFPKGGVKMGGIPLTWGYLILGLCFVPLLVLRLGGGSLRVSPVSIVAFVCILPFQAIYLYSSAVNGWESLSYGIAVGTTYLFLPAMFLGVFPGFLRGIDTAKFMRYFCFCVFAAAVWGIFLFFYHPIMGKFVEIPYLTVNAGDFGLLESTKNISRGSYLKLISTYNNGNVYGVATLILLPLYLKFEPKRWKRNMLRITLVLTLSRTVWVGLVLEQMLSVAALLPGMMMHFPKMRAGRANKQIVAVIATVLLVFTGLLFNGHGFGFLFNSGLGGREGELAGFLHPTLLPVIRVTAFNELVFASALHIYGIVGFLAVVLMYVSPLILIAWRPTLLLSPSRRAAAKGLILYALVANIDGAALLIPVMAFYWFAYMVLISGLPGEAPVVLVSQPRSEGVAFEGEPLPS